MSGYAGPGTRKAYHECRSCGKPIPSGRYANRYYCRTCVRKHTGAATMKVIYAVRNDMAWTYFGGRWEDLNHKQKDYIMGMIKRLLKKKG